MIYVISLTKEASAHLSALYKNEPKAYEKAMVLIEDIRKHPTTGLGKPEPLRHRLGNVYSRRITQKHRLVYSVHDDIVTVIVISAKGHYNDK